MQNIDLAYRGKELNKSSVTKASTKTLKRTYYRLYTKKYVNIDTETMNKLYSLYNNGYTDVILKEIPDTITINGEKINIDKNDFLDVYGKIGGILNKIAKTSQFGALNEKQQAKIISKLINIYYNASKKSISGEEMNLLETIAYFNKYIDTKTLNAIVEASELEATEKLSKKEVITKYINSLKMTRANKYFIYSALNYKVDKALYQAYLLNNLKFTRTQLKVIN